MARVTVGSENEAPIEIHYEDHGSGQPIVLIHGYPLDGNSWERQERVFAYFKDFLDNFYNVDKLGGTKISDQAWQVSFNLAAKASPHATYACVDAWLTDFRADLPRFDVPTLVVHGTEDRILPFAATAERLRGLIDAVKVVEVEGGPHNIGWTHPDEVNEALLDFLAD